LRGGAQREAAPPFLLQADLRALPLRPGSVASALCMGALHLFDDVEAPAVLGRLRDVLLPGAPLYLSSLVSGRRFGDLYLALLERAGEVARPRSALAVEALLEQQGFRLESRWTTGSMSYVIARAAS
jgi:hypothetical protein